MSIPFRGAASLLCVLLVSSHACAQGKTQATPIDNVVALRYFRDAEAAAERDAGKLWTRPILGPLLFVEPNTRRVVADRLDHEGLLVKQGDVYVGKLPDNIPIANHSITFGGLRWAMIAWPFLTTDKFQHVKLMAHESFHRVLDGLHVPVARAGVAHLDTLEGRVWLQLEWRALRRALKASDDARHAAITDALIFRAYRRSLFPDATPAEHAFEMNEGLAEYTGYRLSAQDDVELTDQLVKALDNAAAQPTFVGSFSYSTVPAYGVLLDLSSPNWRKDLTPKQDLGDLLQDALKIQLAPDLKAQAEKQASLYEGEALRTAETARDVKRQKQITTYRKRFLEDPVLLLPLPEKRTITLVSTGMVPLEEKGTVYLTSKIVADWGVLEVTKGALLVHNEKGRVTRVCVTPPADPTARPLTGEGWVLTLAPGWGIVPGSRAGDYLLKKNTP